MNVQEIAQKARKSISSFCIEECKAYCCRKGYLNITHKELKSMITSYEIKHLPSNIVMKNSNSYTVYLGDALNPCPGLNLDHTCKIHRKNTRPIGCKNFPIFINEEKKLLFVSSRCPAIKMGMIFQHTRKIVSIGYKLITGDISYDSDFFEKIQ